MKQPEHDKRFVLHTDGSALPENPGNMGAGYVLCDADGQQVEARGHYCGEGSCNQAEYEAVIHGVEAALRHGAHRLTILSDSKLVVEQLRGQWRVKAEGLKPYHARALALLGRLRSWRIRWVSREQNQQADVLAGNAAKFRRDVDYSDRSILGSDIPDERDPVFAEATRDQYRQRIRGRQLQLRNVAR